MIKKSNFFIILIFVFIGTWIGSSMMNVHKAKNREGIILSPSKNKSVEFINGINTSQLMMNFHRNLTVGGSNIVSGNFDRNDIEVIWQDENTLIIEYQKGTKLNSREGEVYFFGDIVKVIYREVNE